MDENYGWIHSNFAELLSDSRENRRVLSIQSHVVHGYAGNKCSVFPLQVYNLYPYRCSFGEVMSSRVVRWRRILNILNFSRFVLRRISGRMAWCIRAICNRLTFDLHSVRNSSFMSSVSLEL